MSALHVQAAAPVAKEISAFKFVVDSVFTFTGRERKHHAENITGELVQMIMGVAFGERTAVAESVTPAAEIRANGSAARKTELLRSTPGIGVVASAT